jgi:molybdate transport system substrate-binding protein
MHRIFSFLLVAFAIAYAGEMKIASGAGYKAPLMEVISGFEKVSSHKVYGLFGNMKQISTQASDGGIALLLGDKAYLSEKSGLVFEDYTDIGSGKPVLAYPKDKPIASLEEIATNKVQRIVVPQPQKTIYGTAAAQILENSGLKERVSGKIYEVATATQVATYILTGEVDAGFINLTTAL